jgi:iron complex transport system substrate-binding protein
MKKTTVALITIVLILIIAGSSYEVYRLNVPSETIPQTGTVSVVDGTGTQVNVSTPVTRIVSLDPGLTEIIWALGCGDRIVGRDTTSVFPVSVTEIPSVGEEYSPSLEQLLELKPDLVVAGSMISYSNGTVGQIEAAGIPVFISDTTNPQPASNSNETTIDFTSSVVTKLGLILDEHDNASKIVNYMQYYKTLVNERLANLTTNEKPTVYYEWYYEWQTQVIPYITQAGGISIAANESLFAPTLSAEYVAEANPDVILRMISSSSNHNVTAFQTARAEIMSRAALQDTTAVKEGNVYICDGTIMGGMECAVGYLQWAKWLHPSLFEDIDPAAIHAQLIQEFFGNVTLEGVYAYP